MNEEDVAKFWKLIKFFDNETKWLSGTGKNTTSYSLLKEMGNNIVPHLCQALFRGADWRLVCLLEEFVSDPPIIDKEDKGIIPIVVKTWIDWGINKKYLP